VRMMKERVERRRSPGSRASGMDFVKIKFCK
jgi:hypothetical protein